MWSGLIPEKKKTFRALISYYDSFFLRVYTRVQSARKLAQKFENTVTHITSSSYGRGGDAKQRNRKDEKKNHFFAKAPFVLISQFVRYPH